MQTVDVSIKLLLRVRNNLLCTCAYEIGTTLETLKLSYKTAVLHYARSSQSIDHELPDGRRFRADVKGEPESSS